MWEEFHLFQISSKFNNPTDQKIIGAFGALWHKKIATCYFHTFSDSFLNRLNKMDPSLPSQTIWGSLSCWSCSQTQISVNSFPVRHHSHCLSWTRNQMCSLQHMSLPDFFCQCYTVGSSVLIIRNHADYTGAGSCRWSAGWCWHVLPFSGLFSRAQPQSTGVILVTPLFYLIQIFHTAKHFLNSVAYMFITHTLWEGVLVC